VNYAQVFSTPYPIPPARDWGCAYCGRVDRGDAYTCRGCGAPSVLVPPPALQGPPPLSLEWWRARIAAEPPPVPMVLTLEGRWPWPFAVPPIVEDASLPPGTIELRSSCDRVRLTGLAE